MRILKHVQTISQLKEHDVEIVKVVPKANDSQDVVLKRAKEAKKGLEVVEKRV